MCYTSELNFGLGKFYYRRFIRDRDNSYSGMKRIRSLVLYWGLMSKAVLKVSCVFITILFFSTICFISLVFFFPLPKVARFCQKNLFKVGSKMLLFFWQVEIVIKGKFPPGPFLLATNHLGYLDVIVYASILGCRYIAKLDVQNWPFFGKVVSIFGTIFINRRTKKDILRVIELVAKHLNNGCDVCFFPEGTSTDGKQVNSFHPSLFQVSVLSQKPVVVASIAYFTATPNLSVHDTVCWWSDDMNFIEHMLSLCMNNKILAQICVSTETCRHSDYKLLAKICHTKTTEIFVPTRNLNKNEPFPK